jgi:hypothetical protein
MTTRRAARAARVVPEAAAAQQAPQVQRAQQAQQALRVQQVAARAARLGLPALRVQQVRLAQQVRPAQQVPRVQGLMSMPERSTQGPTPPTHPERRLPRLTESRLHGPRSGDPIAVIRAQSSDHRVWAQRGGLDEAPTSPRKLTPPP